MTSKQSEVIKILQKTSQAVMKELSAKELESENYKFVKQNSKAFAVTVNDSGTKKEITLVVDSWGKVSFYDAPYILGETKQWERERSIALCKALELPERFLYQGAQQVNIQNLSHFFNAANRPENVEKILAEEPISPSTKDSPK